MSRAPAWPGAAFGRAGRAVALGCAVLLSGAVAPAATPDSPRERLAGQLARQLQPVVDNLQRYGALGVVFALDVPGLARIHVTGGHVDRERTVPMDAGRAFQIGSQSKMFTAAAILLLVRDGRLSLDDAASAWVPDVPSLADATLRQLLTHTSGLGDGVAAMDVPKPPPQVPVGFRELVFLSELDGRRFAPGARFDYNNFGYDVLGEVIERVSGRPAGEFIRERILAPLGMQGTGSGSAGAWPAVPMARAWFPLSGHSVEVTGPRDLSYASTAGDMIATAGDLLLWLDALRRPEDPVGLDLADFLRQPVVTGELEMPRYGYGMMVHDFGGREVYGHGGFIHGYMSFCGIVAGSELRFCLLASLDGNPGVDYRRLRKQLTAALAEALAASELAGHLLASAPAP